jgi:hypothetical protein
MTGQTVRAGRRRTRVALSTLISAVYMSASYLAYPGDLRESASRTGLSDGFLMGTSLYIPFC